MLSEYSSFLKMLLFRLPMLCVRATFYIHSALVKVDRSHQRRECFTMLNFFWSWRSISSISQALT